MTAPRLEHLERQVGTPSARDLAEVLDALDTGARSALGEGHLATYLVGSFALGDADAHSDVDFLVVTRRPPGPLEEAALAALHARLPDLGPGWAEHLEGSYAPLPDLANPTTVGRRWLYVDNGSRELTLSAHDDTAHARWVLREHGHLVGGSDVRDQVVPISAGMLFAEAVGLSRQLAAAVEDDPLALASAWSQPQVVLTMCRVLHTAHEGRVTSKEASARWALDVVPAAWHDLVLDALADRPDPWARVHRPADPERASRIRAFVWDLQPLVARAGH